MQYTQPPTPPPIIKCVGCNENENFTLNYLQKQRGITDKVALAVVMGNIKQESNFKTTICEGGAITRYVNCRAGGFGLIQWTTTNRYYGLGSFCRKYNCNPNTISGQVRYMVNEVQWQRFEKKLKQPGQSVSYYMNHAWNWLGWGIHGNRTRYAYNYLNRFSFV